MALTLAESLREARSLPTFNGSSEYTLSNYLRDVATVLQLTPAEHQQTIKSVLCNRLQGKALKAAETLFNPTWESIIVKLKEEFGVKRSFFNLRSDAPNEEARNIEELHYKLSKILSLMNTKYSLEPDILYTPEHNEKLIFDIYVNYLPISIKSLLLQNNIRSINMAYTFYLENDILKDNYYNPKLLKFINRYCNNCRICNENKYDRKPINKIFQHTPTPEKPNEIVHMDIFQIQNTSFLTTIDKFTKLGTAHKLNDINMVTIKTKIEERIAFLGKPDKIIMDNEFNNALIKLFCQENNIETHFTTPNSHTRNSDVERMHSTLLEHIGR